MANNIVETNNLTYTFLAKENILNNINLQVPTGSIYGFLGPNGAGKTTTLRLILGLLKKQLGQIFIFGKTFAANRIEILKNIGPLIESPSLYGHLTATENLMVLQKVYQCPKERIATVLKLVGLENTGNKKASKFSLGMKQRLSIAIALLHNPSLLILDEPTNGLDPNGIIEIRELLIKLNKEEGITIIISSHLLTEIEKLVTHVGIINKGKMMFQGTLDELKVKQQQSLSIILDTNNIDKAIQILAENNLPYSTKEGKIILPPMAKGNIARLNNSLVNGNVDVYEITIVKNDLENIFMELIKN
jgi:lantibiotic transport system ATP-binding protein